MDHERVGFTFVPTHQDGTAISAIVYDHGVMSFPAPAAPSSGRARLATSPAATGSPTAAITMGTVVGLDVSLKQTSICVVNQAGSVVREGAVNSDPDAIAAFVRSKAPGAVCHPRWL